VKKILSLLCIFLALSTLSAFAIPNDEKPQDSKEVKDFSDIHRTYIQAWSDWDVDTIVKYGDGAAGYGHSTAFPRPVREENSFRAGVKKFYEGMEAFKIRLVTENYRVIGTTGVAWGHYACTTKQKDGPRRTIYLRYAHTFAKRDGKWMLVLYHRSLLTAEDMQ